MRANANKKRDSLFKNAVWIIMTKKENMGHCKTWTRQFTQKTFAFSKYLINYNITDIAGLKAVELRGPHASLTLRGLDDRGHFYIIN